MKRPKSCEKRDGYIIIHMPTGAMDGVYTDYYGALHLMAAMKKKYRGVFVLAKLTDICGHEAPPGRFYPIPPEHLFFADRTDTLNYAKGARRAK